jgi:hypothetical protein
MATQLKPPRQRQQVQRALDALFREARRLERRRQRRYVAVLLLGCGLFAAAGFLIPGGGRGSPRALPSQPLGPAVSSTTLPTAGDYFSLAVVRGHLIVSGGPQGSLFPSGSTTSLSRGRASGTCDAATVDPVTLKLGRVAHANCGDPALYGERVMAVSYLTSRVRDRLAVRIARVDPAAPDGYTLGPIVMTYPECSACAAEWIYGDGSLWLYDNVMTFRSADAELLRVSARTGAVQERWAMPEMTRTLLAVDADGLWLAPSNESGEPLHASASQRIRYQSLYRVTPDARAPKAVFAIPPGGAGWLVAAGHTVWVEANGVRDVWRVTGRSATPTPLGRYPANSDQNGEYGAGAPTYTGNSSIGIYYVLDETSTQRIVRVSPTAGGIEHVTTVKAPPTVSRYAPGPPAVTLGRSFYFLDPPTLTDRPHNEPPAIRGSGVLYRVTR